MMDEDSVPPSGSFDKSRVLNVKPLRSLVPIFPSAPNPPSFSTPQGGAPFFCASPNGPFPNGATPFYPFSAAQDSHRPAGTAQVSTPARGAPARTIGLNTPVSNAVPISSFRTPTRAKASRKGVANGDSGSGSGSAQRVTRSRTQRQVSPVDGDDGLTDAQNSDHLTDQFESPDGLTGSESRKGRPGRPKGNNSNQSSGKRRDKSPATNVDSEIHMIVEKIQASFNEKFGETDGDRSSIEYMLMLYDLFRRRVSLLEDTKEATPGLARRPDLRAGALFLSKGIRKNQKKTIGDVPGVAVGDIFFFRMELCLAGLHAPSMAGIDYLSVKNSSEDETLAVSIVSSGGYEDYVDDPDVLVYSGQGGANSKTKEMKDQKLERGNLALEKSTHRANPVRVIRGVKDAASVGSKIYVYDGLYKIHESWTEKDKNGFGVFKYKLLRMPDQPEAFRTWKMIEQWKTSLTSRFGLILPDISSGEEPIKITLVNDVDREKGPAHFSYISTLKYSSMFNSIIPSSGCSCTGGCLPGANCACIVKNDGSLLYTANSLLMIQKPLVSECGTSCQCPPNCRNRVSQAPLKFHLEVFKTKNCGWGLRSWDPIRAGAFICQFAGEVMDPTKLDKFGIDIDDDFIFDATRSSEPLGILPGDSMESPALPFPLVVSAKYAGNASRFINHSCSPNLFWQIISLENKNEPNLRVGFFAAKHIPPMTELTYDYGEVMTEEADQRKKTCLCESAKCKGYFYQ